MRMKDERAVTKGCPALANMALEEGVTSFV